LTNSCSYTARRLVLALGALVCAPICRAVDVDLSVARYQLDHWHGRNGFPEESIFAITQSADGYLWVATPAGLVRYNGIEFTLLDRSMLTTDLPLRDLRLTTAADGALWVWNFHGQVWRQEGGRFVSVAGNKGDALGPVTWMGQGPERSVMLVSGERLYLWRDGSVVPTKVSFAAWGGGWWGCIWTGLRSCGGG